MSTQSLQEAGMATFFTALTLAVGVSTWAFSDLKLFEELLKRFPDIHVSGPVKRLRSNFIYGIKEMPVRYTPEA